MAAINRKRRTCLYCDKLFNSESAANRICGSCASNYKRQNVSRTELPHSDAGRRKLSTIETEAK